MPFNQTDKNPTSISDYHDKVVAKLEARIAALEAIVKPKPATNPALEKLG